MQQIVVTHGFVKKLAHNIRDRYGRDIRHTEAIELVADALGWKAGPLMNMLKSSTQPAGAASAKPVDSVDDLSPVAIAELAPRHWEQVALARLADGRNVLLYATGTERHPDTYAARLFLRRKGYSWDSENPVGTEVLRLANLERERVCQPSEKKAATVSAVCNVLTAIREKDMDALAIFVPLLAPATPVAKFVLAYARHLKERRNTRAVMSMLLDALYEDQFLVLLSATSVVPEAITDDAFSSFARSFDYGENLRAEIMSGMFPKTMLAWAAALAVEHDFLRFEGSRAVALHPRIHPKLYGYQRSSTTWHVDPTLGKVSDGRESFLRHLCGLEIDQFATRMDHWQFDLDKTVSRLLEKFEREAVVGGAWSLERAEGYMRAVLPKLLAMRYEKPY